MRSLFLALALSTAPLAATATPAGQFAATDPARMERALKLAAVLNSEAIIVGNAKSDEEAVKLAEQLLGSKQDLAAFENEHPGVSIALAREMMPILNRSARERLGELHRRQAALYAANFDTAELGTLIDFYTSPTGTKLIAAMVAKVKPNAVIAEAKQSEDFKFGAQAVLKDIRASGPDIVQALDESDKAVLLRFASSGLMPRIKALAPQTQTIAIVWMNEEAPWEAAEVQQALDRVMARYRSKDRK